MLLFKKNSIKFLVFGKQNITGRNNTGKLVLYSRGGSHKKKFRLIDFKCYVWNLYGIVLRLEYDSLRNIPINLISYSNGILTYRLSVKKLKIGMLISTKNTLYLNSGDTTYIKNLKSGEVVNSIELSPYLGSKYTRVSGTFAKVLTQTGFLCLIKLKSREVICINKICLVTRGILWSDNMLLFHYKKASFFRYKGWRPSVRGVAMNPIDHPHGGGQGKTSGGRPSVTPWGIYTKGTKTRNRLCSGKIYIRKQKIK